MNFFSFRRKENFTYTIIAGCGRLGANLAKSLSDNGGDVIIIDKNPDAFLKLSSSFGGIVITGDATDIFVLNKAEITKATAVISVTNNDNTNIMIAQLAKELFSIGHVIARLYDLERECIYREFGIDTICPAELSTKEIEQLLSITDKEGDEK
jgi:trk system potassium uptake protein TrkA